MPPLAMTRLVAASLADQEIELPHHPSCNPAKAHVARKEKSDCPFLPLSPAQVVPSTPATLNADSTAHHLPRTPATMSLRPSFIRLAQHARQPLMKFPDRKAQRESPASPFSSLSDTLALAYLRLEGLVVSWCKLSVHVGNDRRRLWTTGTWQDRPEPGRSLSPSPVSTIRRPPAKHNCNAQRRRNRKCRDSSLRSGWLMKPQSQFRKAALPREY